VPLALAQFVASYAGTNMNVAISTIATDIGTTVFGMQTTITLFTLTMAALMIPGSKLTDVWGRRRCFMLGLIIYGVGAVMAALAQGLGLMIVGYSLFEGVGSALMIPPIYILITVAFTDKKRRAAAYGAVSGAAGLGAAAGPLIGGLLTSSVSWRASFLLQILIVAVIIVLARRITEPARAQRDGVFDIGGAVLSSAGVLLIVFGILLTSQYGWLTARKPVKVGDTVLIRQGGVSPVWYFVVAGALVLWWCYAHLRRRERAGREPLVATRLLHNRTSNRGLATQLLQWLILQGSFFVLSVFLQKVRGFSAIQTGLMLTPATIGILLASAAAGRLARRRSQVWLVRSGFIINTLGMLALLALVREHSPVWTFVPGLLLIGCGVGVMLTSSVNVVQSAFPESDQGDISGLSRAASNLGSSLGTSLAGSILVAASRPGGHPFALSLITLTVVSVIGIAVAYLLPGRSTTSSRARA
jgi:MFS family permease